MNKYNTILIDADDTLLDFHKAEKEGIKKVFKQNNVEFNEYIFKTYKKINSFLWDEFEKGKIKKDEITSNRFKILFQELNIKADDELFKKEYQEALGEGFYLIDGAREICEELFKKCNLYCVTNGLKKTQESRFKGADLNKYFKGIFVSEEVGYQKPSKEYFDYVFNKIGNIKLSETIIIGDSLSSDIAGGNNAGIDTCWFNPKRLNNNTSLKITYEIKELAELKDIILK